ncbi:hypothetical protein SAMN05444412_11794 [Rhodonellum ikkaensis]|uniref:Uncharacterized protein n=1 Tax=Rhodonellum ikkaensis TaxID=336829 RepID=A0A1H3TH56_9BACT|nr:hypothetical protein SAMN05444412_11794 [Rhodonellum ikkaensis]
MFLAFDPLFWECKDATLFLNHNSHIENNLKKSQTTLIINRKKRMGLPNPQFNT